MTCVMLGGSRHISKLNDDVRRRLERIVQQQFKVVVGDANGADKAFQRYLADRSFSGAEVFCSGETPRNNLGDWSCRRVSTKAKPGTFDFYAAKDRAMAVEATIGFFLWDGDSVGTMLNVWRLMKVHKTSLIFVQPKREFAEVRSQADWRSLFAIANAEVQADIEKKIRAEQVEEPKGNLPLFSQDLHSMGLT